MFRDILSYNLVDVAGIEPALTKMHVIYRCVPWLILCSNHFTPI